MKTVLSSMTTALGALHGPSTLCLIFLLLQACAGRYQAPLDERGSVLERNAPPIYSTDGASSPSGVVAGTTRSTPPPAPTAAPSRASSGAATTVAAGVRVQPAPGVNVAAAEEPGSIRRTTIGRAPIGGASAAAPNNTRQALGGTSAASSPARNQLPTPVGPQTHTVVRGDTLYSIAWRYSLDYRALALANNLTLPYTIYPNQILNVDISNASDNALRSVPSIPAAPAGDTAVAVGQRPAAAAASRRLDSVPSRVVEGVTWQWPLEGRVLGAFNADSTTTSRGIDIGGNRGDAVYAAADGDVVYAGRGIQGQGDLIIIRHSARHLSAYSHNSNMLVAEGARIRAGDKISEVGADLRGSQLIHFEIRVDGKPVDPMQFLPSR